MTNDYDSHNRIIDTVSDKTVPADSVAEKIRSFGRSDTWGDPASENVLKAALRLLEQGRMLGLDADAFLMEDGAVVVEFYRRPYSLTFTVREDGPDTLYDVGFEEGYGFEYTVLKSVTAIRQRDVVLHLQNFAFGLGWNLLESSAHNDTLLGKKVVSSNSVFETTKVRSRSSIWIVSAS